MSEKPVHLDRVLDLAGTICDGCASQGEFTELDSIMLDDRKAFDGYLDYCRMHSALKLEMRAHRVTQALCQQIGVHAVAADAGNRADVKKPLVSASPLVTFPAHSTLSFLSSGWPAAYLIATMVFAIGLLVGASTYVSRPPQVVQSHVPSRAPLPLQAPVIARITGIVDCQWETEKAEGGRRKGEGSMSNVQGSRSDSSLIPIPQSPVRLGDTFALSSGLLEITYQSGARVIVQGPATYRVDAAAGGYLAVGKLTARLEKGEGGRGRGEKVASGQKSEIRNQKSQILNPPSAFPLPPSAFIVRSPTAIVTDLGTEFGVEVADSGETISHVFRGSVRVQLSNGAATSKVSEQVLHADESARVERRGEAWQLVALHTLTPSHLRTFTPPRFVREMPKSTVKLFDLADVVAGGNGFTHKRGRGIDPTNGRVSDGNIPNPTFSDGKYHRVEGLPFIDGICIPRGAGPVQLDSAGHTFDWFPATDNKTCNVLWSGPPGDGSTELDGIDYGSPGHGILVLHANKAITFNLDAIRRANPGCEIARFRAMTGNVERVSEKGVTVFADVWVFVDGKMKFRRREINRYSGALPAVVTIRPGDRFLTLASTDGGNGYDQDHAMFGDPQLELMPIGAPADSASPQKPTQH
jgi:hypothetical protein